MVKIIADSTCDLSPELIERYQIRILPLFVRLDEKEYLDGVDITPDELFDWSDENKKTPSTAAPSPENVLEAYEEELKNADELVVFTISSGMSSSYTNCCLAAGRCSAPEKVTVIDSANLSTGIGLLVIQAAVMAGEGADAAAIREWSVEEHIAPGAAPAFLWHTSEDGAVPVRNSLMMAEALAGQNVPFALHVWPHGRHGLGLAQDMPDVSRWPELAVEWLHNLGY